MKSSGSSGERLAEYRFKSIGWIMDRHQPGTKTTYINGKPTIINCKSNGIPDYTGYELVQIHEQFYPIYRAVEVKECKEKSMPCSRLGVNRPPIGKEGSSQNYWMSLHDKRSCFVAIYWQGSACGSIELFKWKPKGMYNRGEGF